MRKHYFNPELASDIGVSTAVVYQSILDACNVNATPWTQLHDGRYWVEFPARRFTEVFPYLSENTVYKNLRKLQDFRPHRISMLRHLHQEHQVLPAAI